jgi:hypothetical protein
LDVCTGLTGAGEETIKAELMFESRLLLTSLEVLSRAFCLDIQQVYIGIHIITGNEPKTGSNSPHESCGWVSGFSKYGLDINNMSRGILI